MKISGFTIVKNAVKFNYPIIESINSILPICDEFIVNVGSSEDKTLDVIKSINSPKIRIIETEWDFSRGYGELTRQTNIALAACKGDWAFYLQSDEVIHHHDLWWLKFLMKFYLNKPHVDALRFWWFHFYGSHYRYRIDQGWYQKQERIIRNNGRIESYHDGFGFHRKDGKKLNIRDTFCYLYHYGWTYTPEQMAARRQNASNLWQESSNNAATYDYGNLNLFPIYFGDHPRTMQSIVAKNPLTQQDGRLIKTRLWWHPLFWLKIRLKTTRRVRMRIDPLAKDPLMRILVIRVGNIGDVLMATPVVRKLKEIFPNSCLDFVVSPHAKISLVSNKNINNIYVFKKFKKISGKIEKLFFQYYLRRNHYKHVIILETHEQYHQFAAAVAPNAVRIGFHSTPGCNKLLRHGLDLNKEKHVIVLSLALLEAQFNVPIGSADYAMDFFISDAVNAQREKLLGEWSADQGKYIVVHPGSSLPHVPYRGWVPEKFTQLVKELNNHGFRVFITGSMKESDLVNRVYLGCDPQLTKIFVGHSFDEFALLIHTSHGLVCADTGALHLGRSVKTPVVGLFGSTNMISTGFIGNGLYKAIRNDFPCGPCIDNIPKDKQECLDGNPPACMQSITVQQVMDALGSLIKQKNHG